MQRVTRQRNKVVEEKAKFQGQTFLWEYPFTLNFLNIY